MQGGRLVMVSQIAVWGNTEQVGQAATNSRVENYKMGATGIEPDDLYRVKVTKHAFAPHSAAN